MTVANAHLPESDREIAIRRRAGLGTDRVRVRVTFRSGQLGTPRTYAAGQKPPIMLESAPGYLVIGEHRVPNPAHSEAEKERYQRWLWDRDRDVNATFASSAEPVAEVECFRSDYDAIRSGKVESDLDALAVARRQHLKGLRAWVASVDKLDPEALDEDFRHWTPEQLKAAARYPGSVEAEFARISERSRGVRPLVKIEIVEELAPAMDSKTEDALRLGAEIAKSAGPGLDVAALGAAIAQGLIAAGIGTDGAKGKGK